MLLALSPHNYYNDKVLYIVSVIYKQTHESLQHPQERDIITPFYVEEERLNDLLRTKKASQSRLGDQNEISDSLSLMFNPIITS